MEIKSSGIKPLVDGFKVGLGVMIALDRNKQRELERAFRNQGIDILRKSPKCKMTESYRINLIFKPLSWQCMFMTYEIQGNGIIWSRERLEPETVDAPPRGRDGNTNLFSRYSLYAKSDTILAEQVDFIENKLTEGLNVIQTTFDSQGLPPPPEFNLSVAIEYAMDHRVEAEHAACEMAPIVRKLWAKRTAGRVVFGPVDETKLLSGVNYVIDKGVTATFYLKMMDRIRFEMRFRPEFVKLNFRNRRTLNYLRSIVDIQVKAWQQERAQILTKSIDNARRFSKEVALTMINDLAGSRAQEIIDLLAAGEGKISGMKDHRGLYKVVSVLVKEGVLIKDLYNRGFRYIAPEYESIFELIPIGNRIRGLYDLEFLPKCCKEGLCFKYFKESELRGIKKLAFNSYHGVRKQLDWVDKKLGLVWIPSLQKYAFKE